MECKLLLKRKAASMNGRINRYIMECKFPLLEQVDIKESGINRYIMECKFHLDEAFVLREAELIDTLWNVNKRKAVLYL